VTSFRFSRGRNSRDTHPATITVDSFDDFQDAILSARHSEPKADAPYMARAFGPNGSDLPTRATECALPCAFVALDVDGLTPDACARLTTIVGRLRGFWYATQSATPDNLKRRIVIALDREATPDEHPRVVDALSTKVRAFVGDGLKLDDPVARDVARLWYLPHVDAACGAMQGEPLNVDRALAFQSAQMPTARGPIPPANPEPDSELRAHIVNADAGVVYSSLLSLTARLVGRGVPADDVVASLRGLLDDPACKLREADPVTWKKRRAGIARMVTSAIRKYGDRRERTEVATTTQDDADAPFEAFDDTPPPDTTPHVVTLDKITPARVLDAFVPFASWEQLADIDKTDKGIVRDTAHNAALIVRHCFPRALWKNAFDGNIMLHDRQFEPLDATTLARIATGVMFGHQIRATTLKDAMINRARHNVIDPMVEWLDSLTWDGTKRLDFLAEDGFGVARSADGLEEQMLRKLVIACVRRQYEPGAKFDYMIVLEGPQGTNKSRSLRALFGEQWVADWSRDIDHKDFLMQLRGNLCIEVAELASFARSELNGIKAMLTSTTDKFRPPYGAVVEAHPRRSVLVGTSNSNDYLSDPTGNRRFWPIKTGGIDVDWISTNRDQLFAEAVVAYRAGEASWFPNQPDRLVAEQEARVAVDVWSEKVADHVAMLSDISIGEILSGPLDVPVGQWDRRDEMRVAAILRGMGWCKRRHGNTMRWYPPRTADAHV
jgi:hypothetical protein